VILASTAAQANLARWLAHAASAASAQVVAARPLSGGAIQENWSIDVSVTGGPLAGRHALVLRTDAATRIAASRSREEEFAILRAAAEADVTVPEPLFLCTDSEVLGRSFYLMHRARGTAVGHRLVKDPAIDPAVLLERLGRELARLHRVRPPRGDLGFLGAAPGSPARAAIESYRAALDAMNEARPVAEWGMRWLERHLPEDEEVALCHRDFRTGNYLVEKGQLTAILDWEFAGWSDPHEDLGWFCCKSWRFGALGGEAGGLGPRAPFYRGYEAEAGRAIDPARARWWEVMASIRWLVIALQQGRRVTQGGERSLDLALTGRRAAECELEILLLCDAWEKETAA
jgi:aminoglycoside phosphotransferase (APT) family kinase protein